MGFAVPLRPARLTAAVVAPDGALAGAPSADRAGETPVASDSLNVKLAPPADQYLRINSRAFPAPLPLDDALQRAPAGVGAEALQRRSPLTLESLVAARPVAGMVEKNVL